MKKHFPISFSSEHFEFGRLKWWAPSDLDWPGEWDYWYGTDQWHNEAHSVVIPYLGAFHWFKTMLRDGSEGHYSFEEHPECEVCQEMADEFWETPDPPQCIYCYDYEIVDLDAFCIKCGYIVNESRYIKGFWGRKAV